MQISVLDILLMAIVVLCAIPAVGTSATLVSLVGAIPLSISLYAIRVGIQNWPEDARTSEGP